jgi:hypothetical protein
MGSGKTRFQIPLEGTFEMFFEMEEQLASDRFVEMFSSAVVKENVEEEGGIPFIEDAILVED